MAPRPRRSPFLLLTLLILPAIAIAGVAAVAVMPNETGARPLAQGTFGSVMHPVAGAFQPDETTLEDCRATDYNCLAQAFGNLSYRKGPAAALAVFDHRVATDANFSANCH